LKPSVNDSLLQLEGFVPLQYGINSDLFSLPIRIILPAFYPDVRPVVHTPAVCFSEDKYRQKFSDALNLVFATCPSQNGLYELLSKLLDNMKWRPIVPRGPVERELGRYTERCVLPSLPQLQSLPKTPPISSPLRNSRRSARPDTLSLYTSEVFCEAQNVIRQSCADIDDANMRKTEVILMKCTVQAQGRAIESLRKKNDRIRRSLAEIERREWGKEIEKFTERRALAETLEYLKGETKADVISTREFMGQVRKIAKEYFTRFVRGQFKVDDE
jgi:hypothetical protein